MHTHRIDKYLDTLLANQTARNAMPPTICQKGSAQDGEAVIGYAEAGRRRSPMTYRLLSSSSSYLFASKHSKHKHTESRGRLPERHKHPSMLAALTTKRYRPNTSTQMHKKHKKEEKHSQYTSQQQFNNSAVT